MPPSCLIVAEVAQAHDGSLGQAHAFIDAVARAGADAIKFQTHIADAESTPDEPWRVKFSRQDASRFDYWKRMEFTEDQWRGLRQHAEDKRLRFLSSPFSLAAVELLERVGVWAWKIASGEVNNQPMLTAMARGGQPFILSTGMSPLAEIDAAVARIKDLDRPLTVLQCTTEYPCPPEKIGFNLLSTFRERYGCPVGLSDHSGTIYPGLGAVMLGASLVEVHVAFSRDMFGPDVPASLTPDELAQLVTGIRFLETAQAHPVDKDAVAAEKADLRRTFGKSIVAARDLAAGTVLQAHDLALKKPGSGLPPDRWADVLGRRLKRALQRNDRVDPADYE